MKVYVVFCDQWVEGVFGSMKTALVLIKALENTFPNQKVEFKTFELDKMPDLN